ncbi:MAG: hypothetical protein H6555_05885 [Lewinellaceae bacterium]|nr:hypothetical protein [Lewinellaceae bacterium]
MSRLWNKTVLLILFGIIGCSLGDLSGQSFALVPKNNSPYSRFGLGDFTNPYFAAAGGMGGIGAAFHDPSHLNLINPAALGFLRVTAFETGLYARNASLTDGENSTGVWSGNLSYMALGFPLRNPINEALEEQEPILGWGMAFSLTPYTLVGYDIESVQTSPDYGPATNRLKGTGGTYRLGWTNGWRYKGISVGLETGYLFGKITNNRLLTLDSLAVAYDTQLQDEISVSGLQIRLGTQIAIDFNRDKTSIDADQDYQRLTFGGFAGLGGNINTNTSRFYRRDIFIDVGVVDTILFETDVREKGNMPLQWGLGVSYEQFNKYRISAEYNAGRWSGYTNEAKPENLLDNYSVRIGGEYIPDILSYNRYWRRVRYRAGVFFGTDPRSLNGEQIATSGITLGMGLPIILPRQTPSFLNVAIEAGKFGIANSIRQNYVQLTLGFSLNDNTWFYKRKFN